MNRNFAITISALVIALLGLSYLYFFKNADEDVDERKLNAAELARYQTGDRFLTSVTTSVEGQANDKDWGLNKYFSLVHQGDFEFIREVKATNKDPRSVTMDLEIIKSREVQLQLQVEDLKLDLPPMVRTIATSKVADLFASGSITLRVSKAGLALLSKDKSILRETVVQHLDNAVRDSTGRSLSDLVANDMVKISSRIRELENARATYIYVAEKGLTKVDTFGEISAKNEGRLRKASAFLESYLLPDPSPNGDPNWEVNASNLVHLLAPNENLDASGKVHLSRGSTQGSLLTLNVIGGSVDFHGADQSEDIMGSWEARGPLVYDLKSHTIVRGELQGSIKVFRKSKDHLFFAKDFKAIPDYRVHIYGKKLSSSDDPRDQGSALLLD